MKIRSVVAAAVLAVVPLAATVAPAQAVNHHRHFKNCTELNKVYHHGVGKKGAKDHTSGTPVKNFKVDSTLYYANNGPHRSGGAEYDLDRDNDGVACEKR